MKTGRTAMLAVVLAWACLADLDAAAHDLITAERAQQYLSVIRAQQEVLRAGAPAGAQAQAAVALGRTLDEIRDLLNRDIASHGQPQGLPTLFLIQTLRDAGLPLEISSRLGRYPANLELYRRALALDPDGPASDQARLRLLQGYFYDSFDREPLKPRGQTWAELQEQMRHAQVLLQAGLPEPDGEEVLFILAVHRLQAALAAPDAASRRGHAARAHDAIAQFKARYPDSLRVAALEVLEDSVGR